MATRKLTRVRGVIVGAVVPCAIALLVGCGSSSSTAAPLPTPASQPASPSSSPSASPTPTATLSPSPTPTPTRSATPVPPVPKRAASLGPLRVELWGDSVAAQAAPYIVNAFAATGRAVAQSHTYPGTALCNWLSDMASELDPANPAGFHPQVAIIQFSGDAFTPCMKDANGVAYTGQAAINKYAADSAAAIAMFRAAKVPVYFLSTPISRAESALYTGLTPFGQMFSRLPQRFPAGNLVRYIDTATPLEWHGKFALTLPCVSGETCTGTAPNGTKTVVVRQSDGVHFCPVEETTAADGSRSCPAFMPGAQRFALLIERPISRDFGL